MATAKENLARIEEQTDWQKLVDMAMGDPPNPWELSSWINHFGNTFTVIYGGPPTFWDYPEVVQGFFEKIARTTPLGRPCNDERHLVKIRQAWIHAVFRDGYEMNLELAQLAKEQGFPYNGRLLTSGTPSETVIEDIAKKTEFGVERLRKIIKKQKPK